MTIGNTAPRDNRPQVELTAAEMETVAGGSFLEETFADIALYRAGVSYDNCAFGADRFRVGDKAISKELARKLRDESTKLWNEKYRDSADMVGYLREWAQVLSDEHNIEWDGRLGRYQVCVW